MPIRVTRARFDDRADVARWQAYVQAREDSHYTDLAEWRPLYRELYGFEDVSFFCLDGSDVVGALSLYHIRSRLMGRMLVTCPYFGSGGFYWENDAARDALLDAADRAARERRVDYVELRLRRKLPEPYRTNTDFSEFDLELGATPDETWNDRLASNVRQNIRKSRAHDLEFRLSEDHRPVYDLLRRTLRAHGTPFHGERFFRLLRTHLGERVRFSEVRNEGRLVAGGVVVRFKRTISTPYIGSLAQYRGLRANYAQYWGLIEHAGGEPGGRFEMGRSPQETTHARFKKKWGCEEKALFYGYRVINPRKSYRSVSRPSSTQRLATSVWKRLPLSVTTALGPRLFRHIP